MRFHSPRKNRFTAWEYSCHQICRWPLWQGTYLHSFDGCNYCNPAWAKLVTIIHTLVTTAVYFIWGHPCRLFWNCNWSKLWQLDLWLVYKMHEWCLYTKRSALAIKSLLRSLSTQIVEGADSLQGPLFCYELWWKNHPAKCQSLKRIVKAFYYFKASRLQRPVQQSDLLHSVKSRSKFTRLHRSYIEYW